MEYIDTYIPMYVCMYDGFSILRALVWW